MNGIHAKGKAHNYEKPIPGCLGRMVNLFDFASYSVGNRLLTDKAHRDGSPLSRSRSDVSRMSSPDDEVEDKVMVSELRRSSSGKRAEGTPVKMLIAQDMSKDLESRNHPPNVVAKLMGLDALPQSHVLDLSLQMSHSRHYLQNSHSEMSAGFWRPENNFLNRDIDCGNNEFHELNECRDVHEIWVQPQRISPLRDTSPRKDSFKENANERKMALIRQKFMELKRLAMDEKCHQSKEFQDALEFLNSHRDLFVQLLQEQNSLFSQHLHMGQSIPPPVETKRITVLRPCKVVFEDKFCASRKNSEKLIKKGHKVDLANGWDKRRNGLSPTIPTMISECCSSQPTRIVVLKPNPGNVHDFKVVTSSAPSSPRHIHHKPVTSSTPSSPRNIHDGSFLNQPEDASHEAREAAEKITKQMHVNLAVLERDETLISSTFSNGYTGDESSSDKSEAEFALGNLSDSVVMSPTSRHSWDYVNKASSPYPSSLLSRAPYSPESSVCREAKKRLSERWAMTSSGGHQEKQVVQRESSTLGEMLALSDAQKPERFELGEVTNIHGPRGSTSCVNSDMGNEQSIDESPRNLVRSKSLPASSTAYCNGLTIEVSDPEVCKLDEPKDTNKMKAVKLSFAGKVTSLFFSRIKKSSKEKSGKSQSKNESGIQTAVSAGPPGRTGDDELKKNIDSEEGSMSGAELASCSISPVCDEKRSPGVTSQQVGLYVPKPATYGLPGENQDQPSPISVLDPPFEDDENTILRCSNGIRLNQGKLFPICMGPSNLIDKSPPIGSIARTLSWDERRTESASCYTSKSPFPPAGAEEEEGEWLFLVQSLLSAAGLDNTSQLSSNLARWYSPESPLDPLLREKYVDLTNKEPLHEAKRRHQRSKHKLAFDFLNAALMDIAGIGSNGILSADSCFISDDLTTPKFTDRLWVLMKEWFSGDLRCLSSGVGDDEEGSSLVEGMVIKEVVGKGWDHDLRSEVENIGKEIEGKLLEELVVESVTQWIAKGC
ncbi:hypothetical protein Dimus_032618 [Dionaea muscipula]